ncbi:hypothetical protein BGZ52_011171 [Haplosporangium bisporale]|nr:hypothetical protein BGZ52_011171 [Haplosporangium bisporale]
MVPLNLTVLLRAWNHARSVLSKFDKLASASEEYSRVAQEVPDDAGFEHCMSLFELQVVTAPFAFSAAHLHRYLNDPFRASLLVARELTVVDLPGMSEDFFALRALTAADHERYWTFYNNLVSPKFHDRYSAMVFGLRELWKDIGTGGRSVTLIEPYRLKGVEKYSRSYNINRVLKEQGLAHLPPITSTQPDAAPSSLISNGNATPPAIPTTPPSAKSATPPPAKTVTPISKTTATTSTKATAKTPAKTTATATTASKDKNSGRPALADTQVPKGTPSKPAPTSSTSSKASTTGVDDDFENNEEYFKFMVSEWKKTLDLTNSRLIRIRVNAFLHCDYFSESATAAMADFSNSQLVNICLFADVFNRMLLRRDKDIEKGRQRLIREHSTRKTDTRNIKNTTTTTSSTAPTKVTTPTTSTTTTTATTTTTTTSSTAPTKANLLRNTRVWTEKITQQYLEKAKSGISEQELASSRERDLAYLYLCDLRFEDPMNAPDFEDEEYFPSDEGDNDGSVSTEYSDDDEADMDISDSEATALVMDYTHMDEDGTQSLVNYLESERQLETTHEWIEFQERRLQDPEGTVAQTQRERAERIEQVVEKRAAIAEEMEKVAREIAEQEWIAREKAEKERLARERTEQERIAREKAERERGAREKAERERIAREKAEQGRIVREKAEEERLARDKAKPEKLTLEKAVERIREKAEKSERITQQKAEDEKLAFFLAQLEAEQVRRERESAAAQKRAEQLAQEEQERIAQQAGENIERYMQGSAEQRAREQLAQQQELQVRLRLELNAALEQAEKLGTLLVPPSLTDGTTASTLPQPTPVALINGSASAPTLTPTLEGSPLTGSQERSEMSQADMNGDEEDDTRLSAEAQEWSVEESGLVGEAASVNEQRQPRLNETTKWPRGNQIFYNLHGIDFSLGLWRSPGMAFNLMEKEIKEWYPLLIASPEEINMRHHLVQRLQHLFDTKFPGQGLIIRPFGSYVTGLGDNNSDVDMCVYSDFFKPQAMHSDVSFLASWLQSECQMLEVSAITDAKVPIVKFVDNYTSIHCDLNVQHPLGITNSEMIKNYIDIDDRLPVFLMLLKYFAKCHGILDASQGYLCSYALILMGIVFFQEQEKPILPRLQSKFTCPKNGKKKALGAALSEGLVQQRSVLQAGQRFDCTYDTRLPQYKGYGRTNKKPVAQLLYEFFEFFCRRFDYRTMEVNSQMGQFRERNTVARQKKAQLAQERSTGFKTRHAGNGYVYDGDRHVWMSAEEQTFIMNQESAGVVPRSGRSYPPDHAPEFQGSPSTSSSSDMGMNGVNGNNGGRYHDRFGSEPFLCVMDPFITNRNVAGSCRGEKLAKVWRSFDHAYKCLAMGDLTQAFCTPAEANSEVWNGIE